MTKQLDATDRALLYCLLTDARTKESQLARMLNISKQVVHYRINKLIDNKYIRSFRTSVNYALLGKTRYSLLMNLNDGHDTAQCRVYLKSLPDVSVVIECIGNWSIYVSFWVDTPRQFDQTMQKIFTKLPVKNYTILQTVYSATMFGRVINTTFKEKFDDKGNLDHKNASFDPLDQDLLRLLNKNAREPLVNLARALSVSVHVIKYRLERLKKTGILQRCFGVIDMSKLGYHEFTCLCKLNLSEPILLQKFVKYLRTHKEISFYMRCIGDWDFYFSAFVKKPVDFKKLTQQLMVQFKGLIVASDTFLIDQLF